MLALLTKSMSLLTALAVLLPPLASGDCCCRAAHKAARECCRSQQAAPTLDEETQPRCPHCQKRSEEGSSAPRLSLANRDCCCVKNAPDRLPAENSPRPKLQYDASSAAGTLMWAGVEPSTTVLRGWVVTSSERVQRPLFTLHCVLIV
jgi:hypothetical protein